MYQCRPPESIGSAPGSSLGSRDFRKGLTFSAQEQEESLPLRLNRLEEFSLGAVGEAGQQPAGNLPVFHSTKKRPIDL